MEQTNYRSQKILDSIAPCGLNCKKCVSNYDGDIRKYSQQLKESLGSFTKMAQKFSKFVPVLEKYSEFQEVLEFFTQGNCKGCRQGDCKYPNCGVAACYKEKGLDFCFMCNEFPCNKSNFDTELKKRWIDMNIRMKEIGVEAYFKESEKTPRY